MGAKDTKAKEFLSDNFRFADLCNFYLFKGKPVIQAENLSQFGKEDRLTPVITLTLYWVAEKWDGPRSIHEMLLPMEYDLMKYVADYKLNLIVPSEIDDFDKFRSSLGAVLAVIKASKDEASLEKLIMRNPIYRKLERDAITTINMFAKFKIEMETEETEMDMRNAWEDHRNHGIEDGEYMKLIDIVWKKIKKGYSAKAISDFLEEDITLIQKIFDAVIEENLETDCISKDIVEKICAKIKK